MKNQRYRVAFYYNSDPDKFFYRSFTTNKQEVERTVDKGNGISTKATYFVQNEQKEIP